MKAKYFYSILENKYYFDWFNENILSKGAIIIGKKFYEKGDVLAIDKFIVNGSAFLVKAFSNIIKRIQTGYVYHYAFIMIIGLVFVLFLL